MNKWLEDLQHADPTAAAAFVELDNEHIRLQAEAHRAAALTKAARLRVQKAKQALEPKVAAWRRESTRPPGHIEELALDLRHGAGADDRDYVVSFGQAVAASNPYVVVCVYEWMGMGKRPGLKSGWVLSQSLKLSITGVFQGQRVVTVHPRRLRELMEAAGIEIPAGIPTARKAEASAARKAEKLSEDIANDPELRRALEARGMKFS